MARSRSVWISSRRNAATWHSDHADIHKVLFTGINRSDAGSTRVFFVCFSGCWSDPLFADLFRRAVIVGFSIPWLWCSVGTVYLRWRQPATASVPPGPGNPFSAAAAVSPHVPKYKNLGARDFGKSRYALPVHMHARQSILSYLLPKNQTATESMS